MELVVLPRVKGWPFRVTALVLVTVGCSALAEGGAGVSQPASAPSPRATEPVPTAEAPGERPPVRAVVAEPVPDGTLLLGRTRRSVASADGGVPVTVVPLPRGTTVLHIGDSFAAALGVDLNHELREAGVNGVLKYKTASFIPEWAWSRDLPVWIAQTKPDLVVITLGANELAIADAESRGPAVRKLIGVIGDRPCVWIAIPLWKPANELLDVIRKNVAPCRYMDTNRLVPGLDRVEDGVHPTIGARQQWARDVVRWLAGERAPTPERPWRLRDEPEG